MQIFKKIKTGLATTEGKLKALLAVFGILILVVLISSVTFAAMGTPVFCQSCHEMRPEYVTWKAGDHSKIACVNCHTQRSDPKYAVKAFFNEAFVHFTKQVNMPIEVKEPVNDSVCERCHSPNRVVTPSGDIKIPHDVHKNNGVPCAKCHSAIMHAGVLEGGFTARKPLDDWTEPVGNAYVRQGDLKFNMKDCLNCHNEVEGAPTYTQCTSCHRKLVKPESHQDGKFLTQHGIEAFQDIKQCDRCHQLTMLSKDIKTSQDDPVIVYARQNAFCAACHTNPDKKPASHGKDWRLVHRGPANQNPKYCLVCHEEGRSIKAAVATKTSCSDCHVRNQHSLDFSKHLKFPLPRNQSQITEACRQCHGSTCGTCHYLPWGNGPQ